MKTSTLKALVLSTPLLPTVAWAHSQSLSALVHQGFWSGMAHPFSGIDHLLTMLMVGVWSALAMPARWLAPLAFLIFLVVGAMIGSTGWAFAGTELAIALGLVMMGGLVATRRALPRAGSLALMGLVAAFHGLAHGYELPGLAIHQSPTLTLLGMVLGTALLHGLGMAVGARWLMPRRALTWGLGSGIAAVGLGLATGWI